MGICAEVKLHVKYCICVPQCFIHVLYDVLQSSIHVPVCPSALCIYEYLCAPVLYVPYVSVCSSVLRYICVLKCSMHIRVSVCSSALCMYLCAQLLYAYIYVLKPAQCAHVSVFPIAICMYLCALCSAHVSMCPIALYMY